MALLRGVLARPGPADALHKYRSGAVRVDAPFGEPLGQIVSLDEQFADAAAEVLGHHALNLVEHPAAALLLEPSGRALVVPVALDRRPQIVDAVARQRG